MSAGQDTFGKVAVLFGGRSGEREVSLKSGAAVLAALQRQGVDAQAFDPATQDLSTLKAYDRAFIALHGRYGEDGTIQGALELMDIPYTGSGVMASALGMDKWRTKLLWTAAGVTTPNYVLMDDSTHIENVVTALGLPLFVKPANEGSSIGVSKVKQAGELATAYSLAKQSDPLVIAEQFVGGGEYTVGILGETSLPVVRTRVLSTSTTVFPRYAWQFPARPCAGNSPWTTGSARRQSRSASCRGRGHPRRTAAPNTRAGESPSFARRS